jgi:hypothetical protein
LKKTNTYSIAFIPPFHFGTQISLTCWLCNSNRKSCRTSEGYYYINNHMQFHSCPFGSILLHYSIEQECIFLRFLGKQGWKQVCVGKLSK